MRYIAALILILTASSSAYAIENSTSPALLSNAAEVSDPIKIAPINRDAKECFAIGWWVNVINILSNKDDRTHEETMMLIDAAIYNESYNVAENAVERDLLSGATSDAEIMSALLQTLQDKKKNRHLLEALLDKYKNDPRAWRSMGIALMRTDEDELALYYFYEAVARDPNDYISYFYLGYIYEIHERYDEAMPAYQKAVKINPKYAQAVNNLGYIYKEKHYYTYAIEMYKKAIAIWPENAGYHYNVGNALNHKGMFKEAFREYKTAITLDPTFAKAHYNMARSYLRMDKFREALAEFELYFKYWDNSVNPLDAPPPDTIKDEVDDLRSFIVDLDKEVDRKKQQKSRPKSNNAK